MDVVDRGSQMKVICSKCGVDFFTKDKKKFSCPSCSEEFDLKSESEQFEVKTLNGIVFPGLSFDDIKRGILEGKYLSVDFVKTNFKPWMRLKDSEFQEFFKSSVEGSKKEKGGSWFWFFLLSFGINLLLLFFIYLQKIKIDSILGK
ncbi:MAG: hypothetical protein PWQ25_931 [Deferribacteres bacterium]|jgi:DNA-directed RNA polymerase subunit RPC12/RpoP|nr:hypothetical protein [Deferribacteres bacterium]